MAKDKKIVKFRTRREVNIGLIVAFAVLVLLIINIYRYFTVPHLSLYKVQEGSSGSEAQAVAMILRTETAYRTEQAGYLNYYYREGARIARGTKVYSLSDSSSLKNLLAANEENSLLSVNDIGRLKNDIRTFFIGYTDSKFSETYPFKEEFLSDYLRYRDVSRLDVSTPETAGDLVTVVAPQSGSVTYFSDIYDGYTREQLTGEEFSEENRAVPERNKPSGISAIGSFAYKLVTEDTWQLVIKPDEDSLKRLRGEDTVTFRIPGTRQSTRSPMSF